MKFIQLNEYDKHNKKNKFKEFLNYFILIITNILLFGIYSSIFIIIKCCSYHINLGNEIYYWIFSISIIVLICSILNIHYFISGKIWSRSLMWIIVGIYIFIFPIFVFVFI